MELSKSLTGVTAQLIGGWGALAIIKALGEALTLALFLGIGLAVAFTVSLDLGIAIAAASAVGAFTFAFTLTFAFADGAKLRKLLNALL